MASQMTERPDCLHCTLPNKKCYGNCGKRNQSAGYDHRLTDGVKGKEDPKVVKQLSVPLRLLYSADRTCCSLHLIWTSPCQKYMAR